MTLDELRASTATVLTVTQTASLLRDLEGDTVDERTVRRACEEGQLPCIRVGRRILIIRERLLSMLDTPPPSAGDAA
ncbi:MAG TPA: helix-turn-helix domain-containing protein [Jatrophihabitantaceae bacterium]